MVDSHCSAETSQVLPRTSTLIFLETNLKSPSELKVPEKEMQKPGQHIPPPVLASVFA